MQKTLILYPAISMFVLTFFLYFKNYIDNVRARKLNHIKFSYFKTYQGDIPEYLIVSRQTLKNQFELPIFFYFLVLVILIFDQLNKYDIVLAWLFVISRYIHCYIRLTANHIPYRAKIFQFGMVVLIIWWVIFLYCIHT